MPNRARILVVDDEAAMRDACRQVLEREKFRVAEAADGREALRELCTATTADEMFDVVLLDISMPDVNGWRVLASIQANPLWEDLAVIVVTGQAGTPSEIAKIAHQGALYVDKGTDFLDYVSAVLDRMTLQ